MGLVRIYVHIARHGELTIGAIIENENQLIELMAQLDNNSRSNPHREAEKKTCNAHKTIYLMTWHKLCFPHFMIMEHMRNTRAEGKKQI
jgi:hypothetical protein